MSSVYAPFIMAPPLTSCQTSYLVFGQGTPPYHLYPIGSGDKNGTSLETIPIQLEAGVFSWRVDFNSGANLTWVLIDAKGLAAYSDFRVVQPGAISTCSKNTYSTPRSPLGSILGGVLGTLGAILLLLLFAFVFRRHQFKSKKRDRTEREGESRPGSAMGESEGRVGTFNLGRVQLNNEPAVSRGEAPPVYVMPKEGEDEDEGRRQ